MGIKITYTDTIDFYDRKAVEGYAKHEYPLGKACKQWLADNPERKTVRELGLRVSLELRGDYWHSMVHNGCEVTCGHKHKDPFVALEWIMNMKVPV